MHCTVVGDEHAASERSTLAWVQVGEAQFAQSSQVSAVSAAGKESLDPCCTWERLTTDATGYNGGRRRSRDVRALVSVSYTSQCSKGVTWFVSAMVVAVLMALILPATANLQVSNGAVAQTTGFGMQAVPFQRRRPIRRSVSAGPAVLERDRADLVRSRDAVVLLDLDKTTIWGNDGNDLGLALQWMEKPKEVLDMLYQSLVSPQLRPAYEQMKWATHKLDVVIYTRRPALLNYRSCFRRCMIPLRYQKLQRDDGQLYIPGDIDSPEHLRQFYCGPKLLPEEEHDVTKSLQRLFSARAALTLALGLDSPITVVVTGGVKNVPNTVRRLGLSPERAFLFDDNKTLKLDGHVIRVEPFVALPAERRDSLLQFMERQLPVHEMEAALVQFLLGAKPSERALEWEPAAERWQYRVPLADSGVPAWSVPHLAESEHGAVRADARQHKGLMSSRPRSMRMHLQRQLSCQEAVGAVHGALVKGWSAAGV